MKKLLIISSFSTIIISHCYAASPNFDELNNYGSSGQLCKNASTPEEQINSCLQLAQSGNKYAQFIVGHAYDQMHNPDSALPWMEKSAKQGLGIAQYNAGSIYTDLGDDKNACKYFTQSATSGLGNFELGRCYLDGLGGIKVNYKTAFKWYKSAADVDKDPKAQAMMFIFYADKDYATKAGIKYSLANGVMYLQKSADQCYEPALQQYEKIIGHSYVPLCMKN